MSLTIILFDPSFPTGGSEELAAATVEALRAAPGMKLVHATELKTALEDTEAASFVNLHAPYFPKAAWGAILAFLRRGGGLISVGGAPFKRPVRQRGNVWITEVEQTGYHQQLHIHEALPVNAAPVAALQASADIPLLEGLEPLFAISDTWNLVPHVTKSSDLPHQMGSSGPMDTRIHPLLKGISGDGREVAAPVVLWENVGGPFRGGRWLFVNQPLSAPFWDNGGIAALLQMASFSSRSITELWLKPNYASYEPGDRPVLTLQTERVSRSEESIDQSEQWAFAIEVAKSGKSAVTLWSYTISLPVSNQLDIVKIKVPIELEAGYYEVSCRAVSGSGEIRLLRQGFWGFDKELLAEGEPVSCGRDYFIKNGQPMPVVGMTYMTSDVARKFLFLPNASVWDRDMAQMRRAGINWIRTGIWTAYRNVMQVDGHASEEALRAIDAFLLTAKKHDLQVTFTFFSFTPETWEGTNPYLDPRSVEAQKRFVRSITLRHRNTKHVDWDLINEPSMFDPPRIFSDGPRSSRDPFEREAFKGWLQERHASIETLQECWNMTPEQLPSFEAAVIPEPEDINFDVQDMHQAKKGTRWLDYVLFSMDMHNQWAKQLYDTIKQSSPEQLVVVGQDEALGAQRPSPFFYAEAVDYTTVHSWWLNDHLVWDGIFAKTPYKPNVIQETGIMYVETPEGRAKRSEAELRNILERKYAYAFSTGGAGAVQWIWNTNFYMDNANESHIGALRADGTEKPEADVSYNFGRFMEGIKDLFQGRKLEDIAVVFPYSNDFSNRKLAFDATTKLTRALAYELNLPFRAVGEYHLEALRTDPAKLIILPSAHNIDNAALAKLRSIVASTGAVLVMTGPASIDAYWHCTSRMDDLLGSRETVNVLREEAVVINGITFPASFGARRIAEVSKEIPAGAASGGDGAALVIEVPLGKGSLIWCPLPLELNDRMEPILALYSHASFAAGCNSGMEWIRGGNLPGVYGRKLSFKGGSLFTFVSEYGVDAEIEVRDNDTGKLYSFLLKKERSVLFAADSEGCLLSVYRDHEMSITTT